jgi:Uma2 family endonuclease
MWVRGELHDYLHLAEGVRVEVIGGEIVVSPAPTYGHNWIADQIAMEIGFRVRTEPDFPWRSTINTGVSMGGTGQGHVPDLVVLEAEYSDAARRDSLNALASDQVELVIEITSPSNRDGDRPVPVPTERKKQTKWQSYARAEIPDYLLIDRDPKVARSTLYSIPDAQSAAYLHEESWPFGETITLPEHFGFEIPTTEWEPWV